jgi:phosphatidylglycerophosphate synthase
MFDTSLRNFKDRLAEPLARRMEHINPSAVSLIGVGFGLGSAILAARSLYLWGLAFWLLNRALDGLDGLLARLHDKQDDFGGYLDILLDFVAYAALPLGFAVAAPAPGNLLALALMLATFYINTASWMYLSAILEKRAARNPLTTTSIVMPAGLIGGFETILAYSLFFLFPQFLTYLFILFSLLIWITIIQRLIWARHTIE